MEKSLTKSPPVGGTLTHGGEDVSHGGISSEDLEIPRVLFLQALSPDVAEGGMKAGTVINSITKETLGKEFLALFPFKQYVQFDDSNKLLWKTIDRRDPRVEAGIKWDGDTPPTVTEFINVLCIFKQDGEWDTTLPAVMSFKKTSLRVGRQFITLLSVRGAAGVKPYETVYNLSTFEKQDGLKRWFLPKIIPAPKKEQKIDKPTLAACVELVKGFKPLIHQMPVEQTASDEEQE